MAGKFEEAAAAFEGLVASEPNDIAWLDGLGKSYCAIGDFQAALPLLERVDAYQRKGTPDAPGQQFQMSVAHWCLESRAKAVELVRKLCADTLDGKIGMAPDQAGGATFGLVLHYMAVTMTDDINRNRALDFLRALNANYDKRPTLSRYPVQTVKQLLGEMAFEDALECATGAPALASAFRVAERSRSAMQRLGVVLFHDGAARRACGDEMGCLERMQHVFDLGHRTEPIRWQLARHEVLAKQSQ